MTNVHLSITSQNTEVGSVLENVNKTILYMVWHLTLATGCKFCPIRVDVNRKNGFAYET